MAENVENSKTVQDYLDEQKKVHNSIETLQRRLRSAYDKAQEGLNDGMYDQLDKLADEATRKSFKNTLVSELLNSLQNSIAAFPEDPALAETLAMYGFYGFTREDLVGLVDGAKENLTFDGYIKTLSEQTNLQRVVETRIKAPLSVLDEIPAEDVLKYAGVKAKDPSKMTLQDKVELIAQKEKEKQQEKNRKNKPYMK